MAGPWICEEGHGRGGVQGSSGGQRLLLLPQKAVAVQQTASQQLFSSWHFVECDGVHEHDPLPCGSVGVCAFPNVLEVTLPLSELVNHNRMQALV